jgi:hypothetical protein
MGFLSDFFSGVDDLVHNDLAAGEDLIKGDWSGVDDRAHDQLYTVKENKALDTVASPLMNYFTFGMGDMITDAMYNKSKYGSSGLNFGNLAKTYLANQATQGAADYLGFTPMANNSLANVGYNTVLGAGKGAVNAGLRGDSMEDGAKGGAIGGGLNSLGSYAGTFMAGDAPDTGSLGGTMQDEYGESSATMGGEISPQQNDANVEANSLSKMYGGGGGSLPTSGTEQPMGMAQASTSPSSTSLVDGFINTVIGGGKEPTVNNYMDFAGNLMGLYNAHRDKKRSKQQAQQLQQLYSPDSAYAKNARQKMERRDAAAGRRSQYGTRETQLAGHLADVNARMAPTLNSIYGEVNKSRNQMANNALQLGRNVDYKGLYNMFKENF